MTTRYCDNCDHTSISKCRLNSVYVTLMLLGNDPVHSAHVTATPFLSLIQLFYSVLVSFRSVFVTRGGYLYKERKGGKEIIRVLRELKK
jgi:hypothetical protein